MSSQHLRKPFNPVQLRKIAAEMEHRRKDSGADVVVVRGLSGILLASAMSTLFDTPIAVVRKPNEQSHGYEIEVVDEEELDDYRTQSKTYGNWVIVDDLVASGTTVRSILEAVKRQNATFTGQCVGILLYNSDYESRDTWYYDSVRSIPMVQIGAV